MSYKFRLIFSLIGLLLIGAAQLIPSDGAMRDSTVVISVAALTITACWSAWKLFTARQAP